MQSEIDSCGNCGNNLDVLDTCVICEQPTQFQCSNCYHYTNDTIHTECVVLDDISHA